MVHWLAPCPNIGIRMQAAKLMTRRCVHGDVMNKEYIPRWSGMHEAVIDRHLRPKKCRHNIGNSWSMTLGHGPARFAGVYSRWAELSGQRDATRLNSIVHWISSVGRSVGTVSLSMINNQWCTRRSYNKRPVSSSLLSLLSRELTDKQTDMGPTPTRDCGEQASRFWNCE